jgi:AAA+ ATPase superfamily predicted ATPase
LEEKKKQNYYESTNSEFIVVYGRKRVGKTYLIKNFFGDSFFISVSGAYKQKKMFKSAIF